MHITTPFRIVYNCEIIRCIPPKGMEISDSYDNPEAYFKRFGDGYEYCGGWRDFENMGISVIGVCNIDDLDDHHTFTSKAVGNSKSMDLFCKRCQEWKFMTQIWGFNSRNFDDKLCAANGIEIKTYIDVLDKIRLAAYGSKLWKNQPKVYSYSLGKIAAVNGLAKMGSGENAAKLWQDGKHQEVIDYCYNDCIITASIIKLFEAGKLIDPNTGKILLLDYF